MSGESSWRTTEGDDDRELGRDSSSYSTEGDRPLAEGSITGMTCGCAIGATNPSGCSCGGWMIMGCGLSALGCIPTGDGELYSNSSSYAMGCGSGVIA